MKSTWALAALFCAFGSHIAFAAEGTNELSVRLGGYSTGAKISINGSDRVAAGGGGLGLQFLKTLNPGVAVGLQTNILDAGKKDSDHLITNTNTTTKLSALEFLAVVRLSYRNEHAFRPYWLMGGGLESTRFQLEGTPQPGSVWSNTGTAEHRVLVDDRKTAIALALEGGFDYRFSDALGLGAFLGFHLQSRQSYQPTASGQAMGMSDVSGGFPGIMLGLSGAFRF